MQKTTPTPETIAAAQHARWPAAPAPVAQAASLPPPSESSASSVVKNPLALKIHPALKAMPELADDSEQFIAFTQDVKARGIIDPLKITEDDEIVDGRHRWRASKILKLPSVPCQVVPESEIQSIIIHSLVQRRHYTKGALAFIVAQFLAATPRAKSYEILAEETGISTSLLKQAFQLLEIFASGPDGETYRAEIEPEILAGDTGLGAALAGWGGRQATKGKNRAMTTALEMWNRSWTDLGKRLEAWTKFDDEAKAAAQVKLGQFIETMPPDLLAILLKRAAQDKNAAIRKQFEYIHRLSRSRRAGQCGSHRGGFPPVGRRSCGAFPGRDVALRRPSPFRNTICGAGPV